MRRNEVDFNEEIYESHPQGWKSSHEITESFISLAALELIVRVPRMKQLINAGFPITDLFDPRVTQLLPDSLRVDPLSALVKSHDPLSPFTLRRGEPWKEFFEDESHQPQWLRIGRRVLLELSWLLLDEIATAHPPTYPFVWETTSSFSWDTPFISEIHTRHSEALYRISRAPGAPDGIWPGHLGQAVLAEGLLRMGAPHPSDSARIAIWNARRPTMSVETSEDMTSLEEWLATGSSTLSGGYSASDMVNAEDACLIFLMTSWNNTERVYFSHDLFSSSLWQMAYRLVEMWGPERVQRTVGHRGSLDIELIEHAGRRWVEQGRIPNTEGSWYGWPS